MPEALAVFFVFVTVVVFYVAAWFRARDPSLHDPQQELARLQQHEAWLTERLRLAQRENWDQRRVAALSRELGETSLQLARASREPPSR